MQNQLDSIAYRLLQASAAQARAGRELRKSIEEYADFLEQQAKELTK